MNKFSHTEFWLTIVSSGWSVCEACSSMVGFPVPEILFTGHSGLNRYDSLVVSIFFVCEIRSVGFK